MKEITRRTTETRRCERQEILTGPPPSWRWRAPGCPHGKKDVDEGCGQLVNGQPACRLFGVAVRTEEEDPPALPELLKAEES